MSFVQVCPSIGLALVKRVLCNFTPDEFCPDPVPGAVLEALNAEVGALDHVSLFSQCTLNQHNFVVSPVFCFAKLQFFFFLCARKIEIYNTNKNLLGLCKFLYMLTKYTIKEEINEW